MVKVDNRAGTAETDAEETGVCNQVLNSTVAQECGKKTVVERRDACIVNPSFVKSQEVIKTSHLKEPEVRWKRLSSSLIGKYIRRSNFTEMDVNSERSVDDAMSLVEQSGTFHQKCRRLILTDRPQVTPANYHVLNMILGAGEGNTLMASALDVFSKPYVISTERRSLDEFPDEVLMQILQHIEPDDLLFIIAKVCTRWDRLTEDVTLWKKLSYRCHCWSGFGHIAHVLTAAPALHSLTIQGREDVEVILKFLNRIRDYLRKLILTYCYLGEDSTGLLADIVASFPDLEVLSLEGCHPLIFTGYRLIQHLKKLSELNLSHCQRLSGKTVRCIADSCQHLKKLSLGGVSRINNGDVIHIIKKLGEQLTTLVLNGKHLTDIAYSYLNNCTRLQELEVQNCKKMTDRGFLDGIGSLNELTSLRLTGGHNLTAQALSTFLHRRSMTSIVLLQLSGCYNLDDEGLKGISERCIHLEELTLCYCHHVTDAGIRMVISHCKQLRVLSLKRLPYITGEGYLARMPSHLPNLRELCFMECDNVCVKCLGELMAAAPELGVYQ